MVMREGWRDGEKKMRGVKGSEGGERSVMTVIMEGEEGRKRCSPEW